MSFPPDPPWPPRQPPPKPGGVRWRVVRITDRHGCRFIVQVRKPWRWWWWSTLREDRGDSKLRPPLAFGFLVEAEAYARSLAETLAREAKRASTRRVVVASGVANG